MTVYQSTNLAGADINFGLFGSNFQGSQFQVNVQWGDGAVTNHYGGTSSNSTPIPFNPPMVHTYPAVGSYQMIVTATNPQNNSYAVDTVNVSVQQCSSYIYTLVGIDCNNDGSNETTISQGVPIIITSNTNQYTDTTSANMTNISGAVPGNYTVSIDSFWLNQNGYLVESVSGGGTFTVFSTTTTYTVQFTLICDTNATVEYQCLSGYVFCDSNGNGIMDGSESAAANAPVNVQVAGQNYTATANQYGFYSLTWEGPINYPAVVSVNQSWMIQNGYTGGSLYTTIQTSCANPNPFINFPINCAPTNQGCVSGFVWCDANGDGDFDSNEIPLIGAPVMLQGAGVNMTVYSDSTGFYVYCGNTLNTSVVIGSVNPNWLATHGYTIANNYYTMVFMPSLNLQPVGLGVNCGGTPNTCADLWTTVTPWIGYYQNTTNYIHLYFGNYGPGAPGNYTVTFTFPAGVTPIASSINIPGYTISGNTITWNLNSNMTTFTMDDVIYFNVPGGLSSGTAHYFVSTIAPTGTVTDCNTTNNTGTLLQLVGNSYDPNDKTVDLETGIDYTVQDELTYTIRFQNTGTAPAQNIYIIDTLSANLDWTTISVIESSHTMHMVNQGSGVIRFEFPQIWLLDSTANEPLSHGHVVFRIKENAGNSNGSEIYNTGYIYFDWNPAIVTNTTYNINGSLGIEEVENDFRIYPNPATDEITVATNSNINKIQLIDMSGKIVLSKNTSGETVQLNIGSLQAGIYLIQAETQNGIVTERIIKR